MGALAKLVAVCGIALVGAMVFVAVNTSSHSSVQAPASEAAEHGRMALRMDSLHRAGVRGRTGKTCTGAKKVQVNVVMLETEKDMDWFSKPDPYVKVTLDAGSNKGEQETDTKNNRQKAKFNTVFCFDLKDMEAFKSAESPLRFKAMDDDTITKDDQIGAFQSGKYDKEKWGSMLSLKSKDGRSTLQVVITLFESTAAQNEVKAKLDEAAKKEKANAEKEKAEKQAKEKKAKEEAAAKEKAAEEDEKAGKKEAAEAKRKEAKEKQQEAERLRKEAEAKEKKARERAAALEKAAKKSAKVREQFTEAKNKITGLNKASGALKEAGEERRSKTCSNRCKEPRVRKDFSLLSKAERDLYFKALNELYKGDTYHDFVRIHHNHVNDPYAHGTRAFLPWHRKYLWEFENALRCLGKEFECVTLPYWDWTEWQYHCNKQGGCKKWDEVPASLKAELIKARKNLNVEDPEDVQFVPTAFGGPGTGKPENYLPRFANGGGAKCVVEGPFKGWTDFEGNCLARGSHWELRRTRWPKQFAGNMYFLDSLVSKDTYSSFGPDINGFPHGGPHVAIGGHLGAMRSPADPIFWSHHAFVDKVWARWQDCHDHNIGDKAKLDDRQYKGTSSRHGDLIDDHMQFNIGGIVKKWEAKEGQCDKAGIEKGSECSKCIAKHFADRFKGALCVKLWHDMCEEYACNTVACRDTCGKHESVEPLRPIRKKDAGKNKPRDFAHKTLQDKYEYHWDHDGMGDRPRDWVLGTRKQKPPFQYQKDAFDIVIAAEDVCNMAWEEGRGGKPSTEMLLQVAERSSAGFLWKTIKEAWKNLGSTGKEMNDEVEKSMKGGADGKARRTAVQQAIKKQANAQCDVELTTEACKADPATCEYDCPTDEEWKAKTSLDGVSEGCIMELFMSGDQRGSPCKDGQSRLYGEAKSSKPAHHKEWRDEQDKAREKDGDVSGDQPKYSDPKDEEGEVGGKN